MTKAIGKTAAKTSRAGAAKASSRKAAPSKIKVYATKIGERNRVAARRLKTLRKEVHALNEGADRLLDSIH